MQTRLPSGRDDQATSMPDGRSANVAWRQRAGRCGEHHHHDADVLGAGGLPALLSLCRAGLDLLDLVERARERVRQALQAFGIDLDDLAVEMGARPVETAEGVGRAG